MHTGSSRSRVILADRPSTATSLTMPRSTRPRWEPLNRLQGSMTWLMAANTPSRSVARGEGSSNTGLVLLLGDAPATEMRPRLGAGGVVAGCGPPVAFHLLEEGLLID